jgi:hypothetical protein
MVGGYRICTGSIRIKIRKDDRVVLSSSFCRAPGANAPDVVQPCWLIVLPLDVQTLTASRLRDPSNKRWNLTGREMAGEFRLTCPTST